MTEGLLKPVGEGSLPGTVAVEGPRVRDMLREWAWHLGHCSETQGGPHRLDKRTSEPAARSATLQMVFRASAESQIRPWYTGREKGKMPWFYGEGLQPKEADKGRVIY